MSRDYAAEMRTVIDQWTADSPYVSRAVANEIVAKLSVTDRDLLDGWLRVHAETLIWQAINDRDRSTRAHTRRVAGARRFAEAADAAEEGDTTALVGFLSVPYVVADGSRKTLGSLDKDDLNFVAQRYAQRAEENAMNAAFMKALARKVGKGVVADHFTNEQLDSMWLSISGKKTNA